MALSEQQLAEIEARANAATVSPWWNESGVIHSTGPRVHPLTHGPYFEGEWEQVLADAEFASEARQDVPALIAEVRRLSKLISDAYPHRVIGHTHDFPCCLATEGPPDTTLGEDA
jgi:hypothetical protein